MILTDSTGKPLPGDFDSLPQTLTHGADGVETIVVTSGATTWTQTYTYTAGSLTGISAASKAFAFLAL